MEISQGNLRPEILINQSWSLPGMHKLKWHTYCIQDAKVFLPFYGHIYAITVYINTKGKMLKWVIGLMYCEGLMSIWYINMLY